MQISNVGLYIKLSLEDIKSLLRLGETIDVKIIDKLDKFNYTIKLKNKTIRAYSTVEFKKGDVATLIVEKMKPTVLLKLIGNKPKHFVQSNRIKVNIKKLDIKQLIEKINTNNHKNITIEQIKDISSKIKEAVELLNDSIKTTKIEQLNNLFVQLPVDIQQNQKDSIYIQKEFKQSKKSSNNGIRVVLYASPKAIGDIKIDMLYANKNIHCRLSCSKRDGFDLLNRHSQTIQSLLGKKVSIDIDILKEEKPIFTKKQVDLKI